MESESDAPSWLNEEFFQTLLRENENDSTLVVEKVDVRLAVGKGENFVSFIHKAVVSVKKGEENEQRYLMVKTLPIGEAMRTFIKEGKIFERETRVYLEILPGFQKLQESSGAAVTPLGCKCSKTSRPYTIVMQDLTRRGFKVAPRQRGLDLDHCQLAIKALARFHALSLGLVKNNPIIKDDFVDTAFSPVNRELSHHFQDGNLRALAKAVETWEGYERFGEKLRQSNFLDKVIDLMHSEHDKFSVLNHGDCWVNNMMFKYSHEGKVEDIQFVDFQMCRFVSLGFDIQYFMYSSPTEEVRIKYWDHLMEEYHTSFFATLKSINYDTLMFTLEELKEEVHEKTIFGLLTACVVLPIVLASPEDAPDMNELMEYDPNKKAEDIVEQPNSITKTFSGKIYRKALESMLPEFEKLGVL